VGGLGSVVLLLTS